MTIPDPIELLSCIRLLTSRGAVYTTYHTGTEDEVALHLACQTLANMKSKPIEKVSSGVINKRIVTHWRSVGWPG